MNLLVTGGCGFIGSNLVDELINLNYNVLVIDNCSAVTRADLKKDYYFNQNAKYYRLDISKDLDKILKEIKKIKIEAIFHMAAESSVQFGVENPVDSLFKNINGTLNMLEACRINNIKKFIYSSSSSIYGNSVSIPNNENDPVSCMNPYSVSKLCGENICKMYWDLYGIKTICLRYFNVYGDRQASFGNYAPVLGSFLRKKDNKESLDIYGDGLQIRDFVNVKDVVKANLISFLKELNNYGEVFNVGTGVGCSVKKLAEMISKNIIFHPNKIGEVKNSVADITKIKEKLGWFPTIFLEDWVLENV